MAFKKFKTNFFTKVLSMYLALTIIFPQGTLYYAYAITGGPSQPEFNSFTPIGTSDMVNLSSGDFNYNIPIMDVGGYPINLAYDSGVTMDEEASWVGLGWNLNVGQINRNVRGLPDDFDGDKIRYENRMRKNITVGTEFSLSGDLFSIGEIDAQYGVSLGVQYNNYNGITFKPSAGATFELSDNVTVGVNISSSVGEGATISPSVKLSKITDEVSKDKIKGSLGASINSRQGLTSLSISASSTEKVKSKTKEYDKTAGTIGGTITFNDQSYTPSKRIAMRNENFTFNAALGGTFFGFDGHGKINGYGNIQHMAASEKNKEVRSFGYEYTENHELFGNNGVLDFNREKDGIFSKNTLIMPITNYTYDMLSIKGQGIGGTFRPYRNQVGYVGDLRVTDFGQGTSIGLEFEGGNAASFGVDIKLSGSESHTGTWYRKNATIDNFSNSSNTSEYNYANNAIDYEKIYYRTLGEINVDTDNYGDNGLYTQLGEDKPVRLKLAGKGSRLYDKYIVKNTNSGAGVESNLPHFPNKFKRNKRLLRNQSIQKLTAKEAAHDAFVTVNSAAKPHHTAGYKILQANGATYVYGKTLYNTTKKEVTFAVNSNGSVKTGLTGYGSTDNSVNNRKGVDEFFNRVTTPAYAHTYLLTSILSSDYEDSDAVSGVSDGDLGSYTKFNYDNEYTYNWRVPFGKNKASANQGFYSHPKDQKANYVYGNRKQTYIHSIETKTHIAIFTLSPRKDAYGVIGTDENGGKGSSSVSQKIDLIKLYSKKDYQLNGTNATPIKTAHFEYDYSQCQQTPNSFGENEQNTLIKGKLTLKKVWFTYQNSKMGKYTPYTFHYGEIDNGDNFYNDDDEIQNPNYNLKGYDIWGNYKDNIATDYNLDSHSGMISFFNADPSTAEFPYTEQDKETADRNVTSWTLTSIDLPSGGKLEVQFESDDYQFVQDKQVMQLFSVTGAGSTATPNSSEVVNTTLYSRHHENKFLYVKMPTTGSYTVADFISGIAQDPIYFKFLLNMTENNWQYDYVSGYFSIDNTREVSSTTVSGTDYLVVPMEFLTMEGGYVSSNQKVNPISKAGWYFGRQNMNRIVYSLGGDYANTNFKSIVNDLLGSIETVVELFKGPNKALRDNDCARQFKPKKSWIRLLNPAKRKLGGGSRVKRLQMHDNWDQMTGHGGNSIYKQFYGQVYSYDNVDGSTSGVATFEPNGSKENPFVMPFYDNSPNSNRDKLLAPQEMNFKEKPIGESFFPSPTITYGRVTVKNLPKDGILKHATGEVVSEFYTSYNFPTKVSNTDLLPGKSMYYKKPGRLSQLLSFSVISSLSMSQGFVVETNDMNGKQKAQWVYAEGNTQPISGVEYKYNLNDDGSIKNKFPVVDEKGKIQEQLLGVNYDVINDFRRSKSVSTTGGVNTNVTAFLAVFFPVIVPVPLPAWSYHENNLKVATTTKVVQKNGLLKAKVAYDLGASVSTENLAWDAQTGQVLVTKTVNEYDDAYYSLNYPAHWYQNYKGMRQAALNLGLEGKLEANTGTNTFRLKGASASTYLLPGDELFTYDDSDNFIEKLWVVHIKNSNITLMNKLGVIPNDCPLEDQVTALKFKVIRSGYRNVHTASMASITTMKNPIYKNTGGLRETIPTFVTELNTQVLENKIINASAIEYSDYWATQCEQKLPYFDANNITYIYDEDQATGIINEDAFLEEMDNNNINPYVYNIRGDWRAERSWAYLTGRHQNNAANPRHDGYFKKYSPFYRLVDSTWRKNKSNWTFASQVTKYSPYGVELENKDALDRYSSAQYGYDYTLPTAVASNTKYAEIGFDGFEDQNADRNDHFSYQEFVQKTPTAKLSSKEAHTGRKSVEVGPNSKLSLLKNLEDCVQTPIVDCEPPPPDPCGTITQSSHCINDFKVAYTISLSGFEVGTNWHVNWTLEGDNNGNFYNNATVTILGGTYTSYAYNDFNFSGGNTDIIVTISRPTSSIRSSSIRRACDATLILKPDGCDEVRFCLDGYCYQRD